jgi:hypothetical protein
LIEVENPVPDKKKAPFMGVGVIGVIVITILASPIILGTAGLLLQTWFIWVPLLLIGYIVQRNRN